MVCAVKGAGRLRRPCTKILGLTALVCLAVAALQPLATAQKSEKPVSRKLLYRVTPEYPWDLKRAHIGGTVRMDVVISPHGSVDTISVIGGNPILTETAVKAVKKWKYAPADSESILRVNVDFDPNR